MSKKELIQKLLEKLSDEDLVELLAQDNDKSEEEITEPEKQQSHIHNSKQKRKGSGHSKSKSRNKTNAKKSSRRNSKGKACRVLPMDVIDNRPNKFDEMIGNSGLDTNEKNELSQASQKDQEERSARTTFKKMSRGSSLIDVECSVCGDEDTVSASIVSDANRWKCNSCCCQAG